MSASKEKKTRAVGGDIFDKKAAAAAEQAQKDKKFHRNTVIVIVALVVVVIASLVITSDAFYTRTTAVTVGDTAYSPAEVSYFYRSTYSNVYNNLYNSLGDYVSMVLDPSTPLSEQQYSEDQTWADYIYDQTMDDLKEVTTYYDAAMKEGYTLTEDDQSTINASVEEMRVYASENGYSNLNGFLAIYYSKGMTEKLYTSLLEKAVIASKYAQNILSGLTYTDEELRAYYDENADDLDYFNYYFYSIGHSREAFSEMSDEEKVTAAHEAAAEIAAAKDPEAFLAAIREFAGEDTTVSMSHNLKANLGDSYTEWITDPARKANDTTVIDDESASYVILFVERDNNDYNTVDMRHILFCAEADEDGNYTDEALEAAKTKAEMVYDLWKGDPTEDTFASLANTNSEDTGSNTNGGLYDEITKNSMVSEIDEFLFDADRESGDTAIVYGNNGSYAGYHVVYFVGENDNYALTLAKNALMEDDYNEIYENMSASYTITAGRGQRYLELG